MLFYIGNTDLNWFRYLKSIHPEDVNFWQPGGNANFKAIEPGSPFLFRLKNPINKVAGLGFFAKHTILPYNIAWEVFKERNGTESFGEFSKRIMMLRYQYISLTEKPNIGCIALTDPIFFNEEDWIKLPDSWSLNIVQGKTYTNETLEGNKYWQKIQETIDKYSSHLEGLFNIGENIQEGPIGNPLYTYGLSKIRIGQGAFRIMVTDAYSRRCTISGERTLPVLEAAHIKPYAIYGINLPNNGLLLRSDLHKLFDSGYVTITDDYKVEISSKHPINHI